MIVNFARLSLVALLTALAFVPRSARADAGDPPEVEAQRLVHILGYTAGDYSGAVSGGAVISATEYAEQIALSNMDGRMSPELFARLRAHFSEAQILELGTAMAVISGMAKLSFVLGLVERENYCPFATERADAGRADAAAA